MSTFGPNDCVLNKMIPQIAPISWFRFQEDAERLQQALRLAGIESTIRNVDDPPPGWKTSTVDGVDVWVSREDVDRAEEISHRTSAAAHAPMLLCERCGSAKATVHVAVLQDGKQTTRNF